MAIDTSDFRNGLSIIKDNDIFTIVEFQHVKPGKGGAFVRTRLRNLRTGSNQLQRSLAGDASVAHRVEPREGLFQRIVL